MLTPFSRRFALLASLVMLAACSDQGLPTAPEAESTAAESVEASDPDALLFPFGGRRNLRVMTRNLYLGGDIGLVLGATDPAQIPLLVGEVWASVQANDFPSRARAIAWEIALARPDVIGLQEVALFRTQSPGDFLVGNPTAAEDVAYDYLEILMNELRRFGLRYQVATSIENVDVELPAATSPTTLDDVRYTDRDVVLVGPGIDIESATSAHYTTNLSFPVAGAVPITIYRSWNRVDLRHRGESLTFVNTHPETDEASTAVQEAQAQELIALLDAVDHPTVVVGDLNGTPEGTQTYGFFMDAGFGDAWVLAHPARDGFTCCFDPDLKGGTLFERIDYVLARGGNTGDPLIGRVHLTGDSFFARTRTGLRPSDHAGIVADIDFRRPRPWGHWRFGGS